jgi:RimJ/RimL family protein N-acetyltransferase
MAELTFHQLDQSGLELYRAWFQDEELRRRIEPPTPRWFSYVCSTPGVTAWIVYEGSLPVGQLQLDTYDDGTGTFGIAVNPRLRNQGYGKRILKAFLMRPEVTRLTLLKAAVEPDNLASVRCLQHAGFIQDSAGPDHEGFLQYTYQPGRSNRPA